MKLHIWHDGDLSVGISGDHLTLEWPDLEFQSQTDLLLIRDELKQFFGDLLGGWNVKIATEEEWQAMLSDPL